MGFHSVEIDACLIVKKLKYDCLNKFSTRNKSYTSQQ